MPASKKTVAKKSAKKPSPIALNFEFERDTKNTRRFQEVVDEDTAPVIGTLYVHKSAFAGSLPERITVEIRVP